MGKAGDFNSRRALQKQAAVQSEQALEKAGQIESLVNGLFMASARMFARVKELEQRVGFAVEGLKMVDFRSLAIIRVLTEHFDSNGVLTKEKFEQFATELQIAEFERESAQDDKDNQLENADAEVAINSFRAIFTLRFFKDGVEDLSKRLVRSKIELGKNEIGFPEIDTAILGMKVGETKTAKLQARSGEAEVEITLLGLRKPTKVEAPAPTAESQASAPAAPASESTLDTLDQIDEIVAEGEGTNK
jgi:hypothetical protein